VFANVCEWYLRLSLCVHVLVVRVCVPVCVFVHIHECVPMCVCACVCMCIHACMRAPVFSSICKCKSRHTSWHPPGLVRLGVRVQDLWSTVRFLNPKP